MMCLKPSSDFTTTKILEIIIDFLIEFMICLFLFMYMHINTCAF